MHSPFGDRALSNSPISPQQLALIVDRHAGALVLLARQWCRTPEDVVQDALLSLARQPAAPDNPVAWLYRVVRNGAIGAARQASRRQQRERARAAPEAWFDAGASRLDARTAAESLAALPIELREAVVARIWGELTFAEIAELCRTSISSAQRRYESGMELLRARLNPSCKQTQTPRLT